MLVAAYFVVMPGTDKAWLAIDVFYVSKRLQCKYSRCCYKGPAGQQGVLILCCCLLTAACHCNSPEGHLHESKRYLYTSAGL